MDTLRKLGRRVRGPRRDPARAAVAAQRRYHAARAWLHPSEPLSNVRRVP